MIVAFPRHKQGRCDHSDGVEHACCVLSWCVNCGGAEGTLPTDCPQVFMCHELQDVVYAGATDYDRFEGWIERSAHDFNSRHRWTKSGKRR